MSEGKVLTPERLADIRARERDSSSDTCPMCDDLRALLAHIASLAAEAERLRAENAALKPRKCQADIYADPPRDCDAPFCGCNPEWSKVLTMLQECGYKSPDEVREIEQKAMRYTLLRDAWINRSTDDAAGLSYCYTFEQLDAAIDSALSNQRGEKAREILSPATAAVGDDVQSARDMTLAEQAARAQQKIDELPNWLKRPDQRGEKP